MVRLQISYLRIAFFRCDVGQVSNQVVFIVRSDVARKFTRVWLDYWINPVKYYPQLISEKFLMSCLTLPT